MRQGEDVNMYIRLYAIYQGSLRLLGIHKSRQECISESHKFINRIGTPEIFLYTVGDSGIVMTFEL